MRGLASIILAVALAASPRLAQAQGGNPIDIQALGGVTTLRPEAGTAGSGGAFEDMHASGGAMARVHIGDWGLLGLGAYGTGGDYESILAGGGLSRRVVGFGPASIAVFGGYGYYREVGATEIERSATGPLFGAILSLDLNPLVLSLTASDLRGSYDGDDVPEPFDFDVPRVFLGIGF